MVKVSEPRKQLRFHTGMTIQGRMLFAMVRVCDARETDVNGDA